MLEGVVVVLLLVLRPLRKDCFGLGVRVEFEAELGADHDVLVHVHQRRDVGSPQDRNVQVVLIKSQVYLPAEVERLVRCHIVLAGIRLARYQEPVGVGAPVVLRARALLVLLASSVLITFAFLVLEEVFGDLLTNELQILVLVRHPVQEINRNLILDLECDLVLARSVSVDELRLLLFVPLVLVAHEEPVATHLQLLLRRKVRSEEDWRQPELLLEILPSKLIFAFFGLFLINLYLDVLHQWKAAEVPGDDHLINLPIALERVDRRLPILVVDVEDAFRPEGLPQLALENDVWVAGLRVACGLLAHLELNLHQRLLSGAKSARLYLVVRNGWVLELAEADVDEVERLSAQRQVPLLVFKLDEAHVVDGVGHEGRQASEDAR